MFKYMQLAMVALMAFGVSGCRMFFAGVDKVDAEKETHMRSTYDYSDKKIMAQFMADSIASNFAAKQKTKPVLMVAGVENRAMRHIDTKALTDEVRTILIKADKVDFVNETRREQVMKEQGFQAANATPESRAKIGTHLGAGFMMSGSLVEMENTEMRQVRLSRKESNYYKVTLEITDLTTGKIVWTDEKEFVREASKPLIGW